jgi:hypothetical protein
MTRAPLHPLIRLLLISVPLLLAYIGLQYGIAAIAAMVDARLRPVVAVISLTLASAVMIGLYRWAVHHLELRPAEEIGRSGLGRLALGLLIGPRCSRSFSSRLCLLAPARS